MKMPPVLISVPSIPRRTPERYRFGLHFSLRILQFCKMGWHWPSEPCRGRCRSQPFATKERYGCGSAACRYTSARQSTPFLLESSANSSHFLGRQSRRPLQYPSAPCRGGRLCPPAERTGFYGNLLRIRSFPTGRVGIGPYRKPCKVALDKYPIRVYSKDTPMGYLNIKRRLAHAGTQAMFLL